MSSMTRRPSEVSNKRTKSTKSYTSDADPAGTPRPSFASHNGQSPDRRVYHRSILPDLQSLNDDNPLTLREDSRDDPNGILADFIRWYQYMCRPDTESIPAGTIFRALNVINHTFVQLLSTNDSREFLQAVHLDTQQLYKRDCRLFSAFWRSAVNDYIGNEFETLHQAMLAGTVGLETEPAFHTLAGLLDTVAPALPREIDEVTWKDFGPSFFSQSEARNWWVQLCTCYHQYQDQIYVTQEYTRLWLYVYRSLKIMLFASCTPNYQLPATTKTMTFKIESEFLRDNEARALFDASILEVGTSAAQHVEDLVDEYCRRFSEARQSPRVPLQRYSKVSSAALSLKEQEDLETALKDKRISVRTLHLLQRATARLLSLPRETNAGSIWSRQKAIAANASPATSIHEDIGMYPRVEPEDVEEFMCRQLVGQDRYSGFDYVCYPFPETRALGVAANEQIAREMKEPGVHSDGARVEYVVNRPPRHTQPPKHASLWSSFRFRGPLGFGYHFVKALWAWETTRPRPQARPRSGPTPRKSLSERMTGFSPMTDPKRRVSKSVQVKVPKLRGGGNKPQKTGPDSPHKPPVSPISSLDSDDEGQTNTDDVVNHSLTRDEQRRRLRQFRELTMQDDNSQEYNETLMRRFLDPQGWDVDAAVEAWIQQVAIDQRRARNLHNAYRSNSASPTPSQRTPIVRPRTSAQHAANFEGTAAGPEAGNVRSKGKSDPEAKRNSNAAEEDDDSDEDVSGEISSRIDVEQLRRFQDDGEYSTNQDDEDDEDDEDSSQSDQETITPSQDSSNKENRTSSPRCSNQENGSSSNVDDNARVLGHIRFPDGSVRSLIERCVLQNPYNPFPDDLSDSDEDDKDLDEDNEGFDEDDEDRKPLVHDDTFSIFEDGSVQPAGSPVTDGLPCPIDQPDEVQNPRQPLQTIEQDESPPPPDGLPIPIDPGRCHPCPTFVGEYHHVCRCPHQLGPQMPGIPLGGQYPAPTPEQRGSEPSSSARFPSSGAGDRLQDFWASPASGSSRPVKSENERQTRSQSTDIKPPAGRLEVTPQRSGEANRRRRGTPAPARFINPDRVDRLDQGVTEVGSDADVGEERVETKEEEASGEGSENESEDEDEDEDEDNGTAPRAPITFQQYQTIMYRDEMIAELHARGVTDFRPNTRARDLARRLAAEDGAGNLGSGTANSFRAMNPGVRFRPKGWQMPPRPNP